MTLRLVEAFELRCDRCGDHFEDGDFTIFCDVPWDSARESDWWVGADWPVDLEGPHYCPSCHVGGWSDDGADRVLVSVKPVPEPHELVRDPRWTAPVTPGEWCKADGCGLAARHAVHT